MLGHSVDDGRFVEERIGLPSSPPRPVKICTNLESALAVRQARVFSFWDSAETPAFPAIALTNLPPAALPLDPTADSPITVACPGLNFQGGINLTQIIYLPGWELVTVAALSLSGTVHDNFGGISPYIPPWVRP